MTLLIYDGSISLANGRIVEISAMETEGGGEKKAVDFPIHRSFIRLKLISSGIQENSLLILSSNRIIVFWKGLRCPSTANLRFERG